MTKEKWRSVKVHNSYDLVKRYVEETGQIGVYASYSSNDNSRMSMGVLAGYHATRPGYNLNKGGHWRDGNSKPFSTYGSSYPDALAECEQWLNERYKLEERAFEAIPGFGRDRFPHVIAVWAKQYLKEIK